MVDPSKMCEWVDEEPIITAEWKSASHVTMMTGDDRTVLGLSEDQQGMVDTNLQARSFGVPNRFGAKIPLCTAWNLEVME